MQLAVDDSAPGVPARDLPRLFEPLYRADAARSRHNGGSGLGLAICRPSWPRTAGASAPAPRRSGGLRVLVDLPVRAAASGGAT